MQPVILFFYNGDFLLCTKFEKFKNVPVTFTKEKPEKDQSHKTDTVLKKIETDDRRSKFL